MDIPPVGKDHIAPSYCDRVKKELDWYHSQPDRKPEPVPYPPPRACPPIYGTTAFKGTTGVKTQDNPCANCVTVYGLAGVNALQNQRLEQRQKQSHQPKRRKKWNKGKHPANHKWVWMSSSGVWENGDRYNGVDKVRVRATGQSRRDNEASPSLPKAELKAGSDHEVTFSPIQTDAGNKAVSSPETAIVSPPMALPELPHTAIEAYVYAQEAGRRGIAMHMDYPDNRFPLRQDMIPSGMPAMTVPLDPSILSTGAYGFQTSMFAPMNSFYPALAPQFYHEAPTMGYYGGFYPGPIWLPDGTVLEPDDEEESFREALAFSVPAEAGDSTPQINRTETPNQTSSSDVVPNPQNSGQHSDQCDSTLPSGSPRPITRFLGIQKEDSKARRHSTVEPKPSSTSPLIVSARRVSEGDSPTTLSSDAIVNH